MKVAVTSKAFRSNPLLVEYLTKYFPSHKFNNTGKMLNESQLIQFANDCDAIILALENVDSNVLQQLPKLKAIAKYGVGLDNVDGEACKANNVDFLWTPGVNKGSVAEMTLGLMLMLLRNLTVSSNLLSQGIWEKNGGRSLYGCTIGIIGLGHIGKELVRLLVPFKCHILANDIEYDEDFCRQYNITQLMKDELFQRADIITLHTPLNETTFNLVNAGSIAKMKSTALVINTARGNLIDESALKSALLKHNIAGAALDVYSEEPPTDLSFLSIPNLITTPHIGGNSAQAVFAMGKSAVDNLRSYFENCCNDTL